MPAAPPEYFSAYPPSSPSGGGTDAAPGGGPAIPRPSVPPPTKPEQASPEMVDVSGGGELEAETPESGPAPTGPPPLVVPATAAPEDVSILGGITWATLKQKVFRDWFTSDVSDVKHANLMLYGSLVGAFVLDVVATGMRLASDNAPPTCVGSANTTAAACVISGSITNLELLQLECERQQGCVFAEGEVDDMMWVQNLLMFLMFMVTMARLVWIMHFLPAQHPGVKSGNFKLPALVYNSFFGRTAGITLDCLTLAVIALAFKAMAFESTQKITGGGQFTAYLLWIMQLTNYITLTFVMTAVDHAW